MRLDQYKFIANETFASFTFNSVGPNGIIKKVINYQQVDALADGTPVINLGFGDWDEQKGKVDDSIISNNQDREKILATVASTILMYTEKYGKLPIVAKGSSPAKTRLYQMGINANRTEVENLFSVFGLLNKNWVKFESGQNYEAFLVIRK
ncbi:hypothetical protein SAMN05518672_101502 [Chitinophaga sp. CF118]|uniref:DUF6934 family protein n=1 Tax=Chitinophaga sp. CF118 TaxID=1884367 RepID=UPI0008E03E24|nr:hypothetical protein [Chitinophaga sp. CF118]SFD10609.1 hypothetical protein SAMN05518672_101502 [Chitinophaga sp. CF118]